MKSAVEITDLILGLLARETMYGYQVVREANSRSGGLFDWKEGTVYPLLHKLEKQKLLSSSWQVGPNGKRRKHYRITRKGKARLVASRDAWASLADAVNTILGVTHGRSATGLV